VRFTFIYWRERLVKRLERFSANLSPPAP